VDLESRFCAVSCEKQTNSGLYHNQGRPETDDIISVLVEAEDTPESRQFFLDFKELLKARFQQLDIWLATYPIEVL
jgi:hypothetical protein